MKQWALAGALFFAGTISAVYLRPDFRIEGGGEPVAIARSLLERGTFADPFIAVAKTGPTAHLAPLYPLFMALVLKLFGNGQLLVVFTILVHGLHASLLPSVSRLFFKRSTPGVFAGVLSTALPVFAVLPAWDAMYSATGLILFCLLAARLTMQAKHDIRGGALAGLCGAVLLLTNPATLVVLLCWVVFLAVTKLRETRRMARFCAGFLVALILGCTPWTIRNYERLHAFVFIKDNLGLALYTSNNDCAQSSLDKNEISGVPLALPRLIPRKPGWWLPWEKSRTTGTGWQPLWIGSALTRNDLQY
jgi:hypothetical protein